MKMFHTCDVGTMKVAVLAIVRTQPRTYNWLNGCNSAITNPFGIVLLDTVILRSPFAKFEAKPTALDDHLPLVLYQSAHK